MSLIITQETGKIKEYLIEGYIAQKSELNELSTTSIPLGSKIQVIETGESYILTPNGWQIIPETGSIDPEVLDDYYTKSEVDELIALAGHFEVVNVLPATNIKTNVIYLVPSVDPEAGNIKDEYINLDGTSAGWEKIGSTDIDLTDYYTKTAADNKFVEKVSGKGLSTEDYTTEEKIKLANLVNGAQSDWTDQDSSAASYILNKPTLGTAASTNSTDYATAAQGAKADSALQTSGGEMTGDVTTSNTTFTDISLITKEYADEHDIPYWIGTRAQYEALEEPLAEGTVVFLEDESISYNELINKPQINGFTLEGNKTFFDLGFIIDTVLSDSSDRPVTNAAITAAINSLISRIEALENA